MKTLLSTVALAGALLVPGMAPASAQSNAAQAPDLNGPYVTYSWGVVYQSSEGPAVAYTWNELKRQSTRAQAAARSQGAIGQAAADRALVEGVIHAPSYNTYSWGVTHATAEGPQVSYTWEELKRLANTAGGRG